MRSKQEILKLKEQAVALRLAGKSLRQIREILGPMSNATLNEALRGVPPPQLKSGVTAVLPIPEKLASVEVAAPGEGLEPSLRGPKPRVLPDYTIRESRPPGHTLPGR